MSAPNYHGYDTDFDWDRRFFIPFIRNYCVYYKFVPFTLACILNWLILFKSPTYSSVYRRSLAFYHFTEFVFDVHHLILFVPYPLFPQPIYISYGILCTIGGPPTLTLVFTVTTSGLVAASFFLLIFIRMRTIVPISSLFRLTSRQCVFAMGTTITFILANIPTFAFFTRDTENKTEILQRPEFAFVNEAPGAIVFGEMFELGALNIAMIWLSFSIAYGTIFLTYILTTTSVSIAKERKKLMHVRKAKDNATKMLMIQLAGSMITFVYPLIGFFAILKFGLPTSNPNLHSVIRFTVIFLFVNNSMVSLSIHIFMNRAYQRQNTGMLKRINVVLFREISSSFRKLLVVVWCSEARVDFTFSKILDEYDFWGQSSVTVDGLCRDTCHIYASTTEESRKVASSILIQTSKGFVSIADVADQRDHSTGQKLSLEISNTPTLTIVNGNNNQAAGPLVLYIVNKQAPNFAGAEVYEADGMLRPPTYVTAITVMSARPFTLKQGKAEGVAAGSPQGVRARLTGFDALSGGYDSCIDVYYLNTAPFPGFTMEINGPIVSLFYEYGQFMEPSGDVSATVGITNQLQMQPTGFYNSVGFHGCSAKQSYKSSLYNYNAPSRVDVMHDTPQHITLNVLTNADEKHSVEFMDVPTGETNVVSNTNAAEIKYYAQDVITTWQQDGIVEYHYLVRYNATIV